MSIWRSMPVTVKPEITLVDWRIMETERGERHFVGIRLDTHVGRVSSAIVRFDFDRLVGVTISGRVYKLLGVAGLDGNADYVWSGWRLLNRVSGYADVTDAALRRPY